jgi:Zn-finger protein
LPNNPQVGVTYKSGGIHLRKQPGGSGGPHSSYDTQAELCWGCHDLQPFEVSEWGRDDGPGDSPNNNSAILGDNGNIYDFGYVTESDWTTLTWSSAYSANGNYADAYFEYKTGAIQSTHSTNITNGHSNVTWNGTDNQWEETVDAVADLQCHNCHDVHNMNFAKNDTMSGNPYLRGSWLSNPYLEDGAPRSPTTGNTTYGLGETNLGPVPRGTTVYNNIGGYQIDQNNEHATFGPPTKGWVGSTAGGLCLLCHGANGVDGMDQETDEDLWITAGKNGHSNSALGGTAHVDQVTDIFSYNDRNNSDPSMFEDWYGVSEYWGPNPPGNPSMGYMNASGMNSALEAADMRSDGFRSSFGYGGTWSDIYEATPGPLVTNTADYAFNVFDWGVTQDSAGTINKGYHAFSCSKCHSPHASRLPKLMITNCLDTKQNTWDNQWVALSGSSTEGASLDSANDGKTLSNVTSAQNCHRLGDPGQSGTGEGWNLVTPRNLLPDSGI